MHAYMSEKELKSKANEIWDEVIKESKKRFDYSTYYEKIAEDEIKKIISNSDTSSLKDSISRGFNVLKEVLDKDW